ncbi:MAG: hypothetical protein DVB28_002180 [Verrucomicrobia bacterium]|nr:MAG: hypothetical protein DVB28_002180 [Verrucomicrobiota bacterium]
MNERILCALAGAMTLAGAATSSAVPAKTIAVNQFPKEAQLVERVLVPVPSEVFSVLDKLGKPNWPDVLRPQKGLATPAGGKEQISLMLGVVIAEGFIAVEAENGEEVKNIGNSVRSLAKAIGVEKAVSRRANSIVEYAEKKRWAEVRKELDLALTDVRQAMMELNSESLAQLVSLGGWLRGTEALSTVVGKSFSKDGAELLHQPVLVEHFHVQLQSLPEKARKEAVISKILSGLHSIRPLMGASDGASISEKDVREIGKICAELVSTVNAKTK